MKKAVRNLLLILLVLAVVWVGWLYAYHHTKNPDDLPSLESLQVEDLKDLVGYKRAQLISVWDKPDDTTSTDQDVWSLEKDQYLVVSYGANDRVKEATVAIP